MICNKCGKEIENNSKFCEYCGSNIDENKNKLIIRKKIIIIISFIVICISIIIGFLIYKNSRSNKIKNVINQNTETKGNVAFNNLSVEENNGYKTFNFTIDDVTKAYLIDENKILFDKDGPFCEKNHGTTRAIFHPNKQILTQYDKYLADLEIVYEDISRKVISIDTPIGVLQIDSILTDYNIELEEAGDIIKNNAYECMLSLLARIKIQISDIEVLNDTANSKYLYFSSGIGCGRYKIVLPNIGIVQCLITKPLEFHLAIKATNEDEFYNSTPNELLNLYLPNIYTELEYKNEMLENSKPEISNNETDIINETNEDGITGIEQAIKDGAIGEDYLTKGVTEDTLRFAYSDGNLQMYYDSWEECLADAKKLNIIKNKGGSIVIGKTYIYKDNSCEYSITIVDDKKVKLDYTSYTNIDNPKENDFSGQIFPYETTYIVENYTLKIQNENNDNYYINEAGELEGLGITLK